MVPRSNRTFRAYFGNSNRCILVALAVTFNISATTEASAQASPARSDRMIDRFENDAFRIHTWRSLHAFYKRYRQCNVEDAEVETGVMGYVTDTLANRWGTLPIASRSFAQDAPYKRFVLSAINITAATKDLNKISYLASCKCPERLHSLCQEIKQSIRDNQ